MGTFVIDLSGMTGVPETSGRRRPKFLLLPSPLWSPPWPGPSFWSTTSQACPITKATLSPYRTLCNSSPRMKSVIWWEAIDLPGCFPCKWHVQKMACFWGGFLQHDVPKKSKKEQKKLFETFAEQMHEHPLVRDKLTKRFIEDRHVRNCFNDFKKTSDGERGTGNAVQAEQRRCFNLRSKWKPRDQRLNNRSPRACKGGTGMRSYWRNLRTLNERIHASTTTSDNGAAEQREKMERERENLAEVPKRQSNAYAATREAEKRRRESKERATRASDLFKAQALRDILASFQQNSSAFHAFSKAFCMMASQEPPKHLNLPEIP